MPRGVLAEAELPAIVCESPSAVGNKFVRVMLMRVVQYHILST